jgi:hypothetical protein
MNAQTIINKVNGALTKVNGMARAVSLRKYTASGDALIGRQTLTPTDIPVTPQPTYNQLGKRDAMLMSADGKQYAADDYKLFFSPSSVQRSDIEDATTQIVLTDADGTQETLRIIFTNWQSFGGQFVLLTMIARSVANNV